MYGILYLTTFVSVHDSKFYVEHAHFHSQSIKASPVTIACKMLKLFRLFHWSTQQECTIMNQIMLKSSPCPLRAQLFSLMGMYMYMYTCHFCTYSTCSDKWVWPGLIKFAIAMPGTTFTRSQFDSLLANFVSRLVKISQAVPKNCTCQVDLADKNGRCFSGQKPV